MTEPVHLAQVRHGYDTVARHYAELLPGLSAEHPLDVAVIDDFVRRCLNARLGPVADVGCGAGRVSAYLAKHGLDVLGFDLSPGMVDVARHAHPQLSFEVARMEALPIADRAMGGVLAWYSVIHTPPIELPHVIGEFARVLAPGGYLLMAFQSGAGERVERSSGYSHGVAFTNYRYHPDAVITALDDVGVDVLVHLTRAAEGREQSGQAFLLATERA